MPTTSSTMLLVNGREREGEGVALPTKFGMAHRNKRKILKLKIGMTKKMYGKEGVKESREEGQDGRGEHQEHTPANFKITS